MRWNPSGVDMVPGKLKKILWARTDRFDCGGRQFKGSGLCSSRSYRRSGGSRCDGRCQAEDSQVVGAAAQRALYTANSPTRAAVAAVAALYAAGFDPNTGLAPSPIAPIEERKAPAMEPATSHATTSKRS